MPFVCKYDSKHSYFHFFLALSFLQSVLNYKSNIKYSFRISIGNVNDVCIMSGAIVRIEEEKYSFITYIILVYC